MCPSDDREPEPNDPDHDSGRREAAPSSRKRSKKGLRPLTDDEMRMVAGGADTEPSTGPPITVTANPPVTVTANPPVTVTANPPVTADPPTTGQPSPPPPPPPGCPPPSPSSDWAANNPSIQSALATAKGDQAGVDRAIGSWDTIASAANGHGIDPALLAAIGIRETNFSDIGQIGGGQGRGVFQIDLGAHPDVSEAQANDLTFASDYAANILQQNQATLAAEYPGFTPEQLQQATAASYNFGTGNISGNPATIDQGTTGNNYGSNVQSIVPAFKDPATGLTPKAGSANGGKDGC